MFYSENCTSKIIQHFCLSSYALNGSVTSFENLWIDVDICSDPSGGAGFPGGAPPFGMPGLNELFNDPEVLMAMQVR